jgi:hypothetical protein
MMEAGAASTLEIYSILIGFFAQEAFIAFIRHESLTFDMYLSLTVCCTHLIYRFVISLVLFFL